MPDNKIDGIKKLSKEDIEKSRKIVLESINEPTKREEIKKDTNKIQPKQKKVDGVLSFKNVLSSKKPVDQKSNLDDNDKKNKIISKYLSVDIKSEKAIKNISNFNKQPTERKKVKKRPSTPPKIKEKATAPKEQKQKPQKPKDTPKNYTQKSKNPAKNWRLVLKNTIIMFLILILMTCFAYLIFITIIIKFEIDSGSTRYIAKYIPIPALITKNGVIEYYQYCDIKNEVIMQSDFSSQTPKDTKLAIIEKIILKNLISKYDLENISVEENDEIYKKIDEKIIFDTEINKVPMNRIKKIKQLANDGNFNEIAEKYGDKFGQVLITPDNKNMYDFSEQIKNLNTSEISDVIINSDGYNIFHCRRKENNLADLDFVLVKNKTLEEYLNESIKNSRMISLVD